MENPRTTSARDHDDHELINAAVEQGAPVDGSTSGGNLAQHVASLIEEAQVGDPDAHGGPEKQDDIDNDQAFRNQRPR